MMDSSNNVAEFITVHQEKLDRIGRAINLLAENNEDRVQIEFSPNSPPELISGSILSSDFEDLDPKTADEIADVRNSGLLARAETEVLALLRFAGGQAIVLSREDAQTDEEFKLVSGRILETCQKYEKASWQEASYQVSDGAILTVRDTHIQNVLDFQDVNSRALEIHENGLTEQLALFQIEDRTLWVNRVVDVEDDASYENKVGSVFGGDESVNFIGKIAIAKINSIDEDSNIESIFHEIWHDYVGSAREYEVGALVDEAEDQARATRDSNTLASAHLTYLPSADNLNDYLNLLGIE